MIRWLVVAAAACGGEAGSTGPGSGTAGSAPPPAPVVAPATLAGCAPAEPAPRLFGVSLVRVAPGPAPDAVAGSLTVTGSIDKNLIRRYIRRNIAKVTLCYQRALSSGRPGLAGTVSTEFTIMPDGKVAPDVQATGVDPGVASCIANVIRAIQFPGPFTSSVHIRYPFILRTPDAPPPPPPPPPAGRRQQRAILDTINHVDLSAFLEPGPVQQWTPFAAKSSNEGEAPAAMAAARAVSDKLPAVDRCYDGARGSVRAMLVVGDDGAVSGARVGGLGDRAIESCIAAVLVGVRTEAHAALEVACDFSRGGDAPWRVTPDAGYTVIDVTRTELRRDGKVYPTAGALDPVDRAATHLVIAEPDVPGDVLQTALDWASGGAATLVAVKASGGAPVFVGMGPARGLRSPSQQHLELRARGGSLEVCIGGTPVPQRPAPILDPHAMDFAMKGAAKACADCAAAIAIGVDPGSVAKDLVAVTSAAQRAGHHALVIGDRVCGD